MEDLDLAELAAVARRRDLRFVALFGSHARGTARAGSDLDLALMPAHLNRQAGGSVTLAADLIHALRRSDLDFVYLPEASWLVSSEVARDGRPLYEAWPGAFRDFQEVAHWRRVDGRRRRDLDRGLLQRYLAGDWTMNDDLVRQRLESMARYLRELEAVLESPKEVFVSEPRDHHATERLAELLVEGASRINTEVSASVAGLPASDYDTSFFSLSSAGWLEPETARALAPLAGLRNILVHQYEEIHLPDLYDSLKASLPDWRAYLASVARHLEQRT